MSHTEKRAIKVYVERKYYEKYFSYPLIYAQFR